MVSVQGGSEMLIWVNTVLPVTMCRFSSKFKEGEVTTLHRDDLPVLKEILSHSVDPIEVNVHTHTCSLTLKNCSPTFTSCLFVVFFFMDE